MITGLKLSQMGFVYESCTDNVSTYRLSLDSHMYIAPLNTKLCIIALLDLDTATIMLEYGNQRLRCNIDSIATLAFFIFLLTGRDF